MSNRKFSTEQIKNIRNDYLYNGYSYRDLVTKYDVDINSIALIIKYVHYNEIQPELKELIHERLEINKEYGRRLKSIK